jgi:hypothetical protein
MIKRRTVPVFWLLIPMAIIFSLGAHAQWQTQSILVKPGWTAVYLHVDASYQGLDQLVGNDPSNPISEIWLWQPAGSVQFVNSPQAPSSPNSQWANWGRIGLGGNNTLSTLIPNAAYLVHSVAQTNYTWRVLGKPASPSYTWTTTGLNFLGFPTPAVSPPNFDTFLSLAPTLQNAEIFQYQGGNLGPLNPNQLFAFHSTPVTRGQAFWIRSGSVFNNYFGPFAISIPTAAGVSFSTNLSQFGFRLQNLTSSNVTVMLNLLRSEGPPAGQTPIVDVPPILVRGALMTSNLTYSFSTLSVGSPTSWTLTPQGQQGSDIQVVLGVNRYQLSNNPGALYAGILEFTDSFGFSQVDIPVSAVVASTAGLWVGKASVTQVRNYLKNYERDSSNTPVVSSNGNYTVTSVYTNLGPVAQPYPLRLIVHNDGTHAFLLQRVYYGLDPYSNVVVATQEKSLDPSHLDLARRISAIHLPWSASNTPWPFSGQLVQGGTLTASPQLAYDDQTSNPFLHTYHPDHDNLDPTFSTQLPQGYESYQMSRQITLNISAPGNDFTSLTSANQGLVGTYLETITLSGQGGASRAFDVSGIFSLNRISPISTLTQ